MAVISVPIGNPCCQAFRIITTMRFSFSCCPALAKLLNSSSMLKLRNVCRRCASITTPQTLDLLILEGRLCPPSWLSMTGSTGTDCPRSITRWPLWPWRLQRPKLHLVPFLVFYLVSRNGIVLPGPAKKVPIWSAGLNNWRCSSFAGWFGFRPFCF